jgi:hypothetical protein
MNKDDRAGSICDTISDGRKIKIPVAVVAIAVGNRTNIIQSSEIVKKRIARFGNQHFIIGIAEEAKQPGVRLTRTCSEKKRFRIHHHPLPGVPAANGVTTGAETLRIGFIPQRCR